MPKDNSHKTTIFATYPTTRRIKRKTRHPHPDELLEEIMEELKIVFSEFNELEGD